MKPYFAFQWHITDECDQRCRHCYIFSENNDICLNQMSYENMEKVVASCIEMCDKLERTPYFYITGGDPILHKDFWKVCELLKKNNITFGILGNPFHLNDDCAIMATVSCANKDEFPDMIDLVVEKNVDVFAFGRYCPTSGQKAEEYHISPLEYRAFLEKCYEKFQQYKDRHTTFQLKDHLWTLLLYEKGIFKIPENADQNMIYDGCHCAISHMTILPTGDVYACRRMDKDTHRG